MTFQKIVKVHSVRNLTENTYILRMKRKDFPFRAGQYIRIGFQENHEMREYSIYSSEDDPYLEVLIKEVEIGSLSKQLKKCKPGQSLQIEGPFGYFTLSEQELENRSLYLIASGTGIAPFHSMAQTFPKLNYHLIHGVRGPSEAYERAIYPRGKYICCTSREKGGDHFGRVTNYLETHPADMNGTYLLCGNGDMINDVIDVLSSKGIPLEHMRTEVYF